MKVNSASQLGLIALASFLVGCGGSAIPPDVRPNLIVAEEIRAKLMLAGGSATAQPSEQIAFGNQFATLSGVVTLDGPAPPNPTLKVDKDVAVCKPDGQTVTNDVVIVGSGNGLANVLLYAEIPDEWCHESKIGNTDTVDFDQKSCLFVNRIFPMQTTQKLRILNSDSVGHNASMKPGKNPQYNPNIAGGGEAMYPPGDAALKPEKAPFPISCAAHPWMQSYMIFRGNGYFDVTKSDGSFKLDNLPAGVPVKITVWHEVTKGISGKSVSVEPAGIAQGWSKRGAFTVNLEPESQTELKIAVNASALTK